MDYLNISSFDIYKNGDVANSHRKWLLSSQHTRMTKVAEEGT